MKYCSYRGDNINLIGNWIQANATRSYTSFIYRILNHSEPYWIHLDERLSHPIAPSYKILLNKLRGSDPWIIPTNREMMYILEKINNKDPPHSKYRYELIVWFRPIVDIVWKNYNINYLIFVFNFRYYTVLCEININRIFVEFVL